MFSIAYAMAPAGGQNGQAAGGFSAFIPLVLMFVIFYFLLIRPQQKKTKNHQQMVNSLNKGNRVITSGGIHGVITSTDEATVTVEIAEKVRIKILRGNIAALNEPPVKKEPAKKGKKEKETDSSEKQ